MFERRTNNPLLVKGDIGRAKPTTSKLPPPDFVYGKVFMREVDEDSFNQQLTKINWPKNSA